MTISLSLEKIVNDVSPAFVSTRCAGRAVPSLLGGVSFSLSLSIPFSPFPTSHLRRRHSRRILFFSLLCGYNSSATSPAEFAPSASVGGAPTASVSADFNICGCRCGRLRRRRRRCSIAGRRCLRRPLRCVFGLSASPIFSSQFAATSTPSQQSSS